MSRVVSCYKYVVDEQDVVVNPDSSVSTDNASRKISDYDRCAIVAGSKLAKEIGAGSACLTFGDAAAEKSLKDALSRGPEEAFAVIDEGAAAADARATGRVLAAALRTMGDAAVVVCADGSSDVYQRQTGARIAAALGWGYVPAAVSAEAEEGGAALLVVQKLEDCLRTVRVETPCVIAVLPEFTEVPTPGMKDILSAKKKPQTTWSLADVEADASPGVEAGALRGYVVERKREMLDAPSAQENVAALVTALKKEGVL
ncbi:MAG: electron transfer flavoprotein [Eggerthellaceae bacterium]|nr:electron transfer flavoprotein [Eggerthellaceae bacterium]